MRGAPSPTCRNSRGRIRASGSKASPAATIRRSFDRTPLQREQTVEDIGNAAAFLASEAAKNITGQSLMVDGGMVEVLMSEVPIAQLPAHWARDPRRRGHRLGA